MTDSWCFARRCRTTLPLPPHPPAQPLWAFWGRCSLATSRWRPVYPLPWWPHSLTPGTSPLRGEHIITTAKSSSAIKILDRKGIVSLYFGFTVKLIVWASTFGISFIIKMCDIGLTSVCTARRPPGNMPECLHRNKTGILGWRSEKTEVVNGYESKVWLISL